MRSTICRSGHQSTSSSSARRTSGRYGASAHHFTSAVPEGSIARGESRFDVLESRLPVAEVSLMRTTKPYLPTAVLTVTALAISALLSACGGSTSVRTPAPELQLLESSSLTLPADCEPRPGEIYRAAFEVGLDGRVQNVRTN